MPFTGSKSWLQRLFICFRNTRPKTRESKHTLVYGLCTCTLPRKMHYCVTDTTEDVRIPKDKGEINVSYINKWNVTYPRAHLSLPSCLMSFPSRNSLINPYLALLDHLNNDKYVWLLSMFLTKSTYFQKTHFPNTVVQRVKCISTWTNDLATKIDTAKCV